MESSGNNSSVPDTVFSARIAFTVESAIGLSLECIIAIILLLSKAYKSFLQRIFMCIVLTLIVMDTTYVTSLGHHKLTDRPCAVVAFIQLWSEWCTYIFLLVILLYLLARVCLLAKDNSLIMAKLQTSRYLRILLEVGVILVSLIIPMIVLWVPFSDNKYVRYGFNDFTCGFKRNSSELITNGSIFITIYFVMYTPAELVGLVAILTALGMMVSYYSLSSKLQHYQQARHVIRKLIASLVVVIICIVAFNIFEVLWITIRTEKHHDYMTMLSFTLLTKSLQKTVLLIGYLLMFHFSNVCDPLKKYIKKKKREHIHNLYDKRVYGTIKESHGSTYPSSTYFNVSHTGQFTTVSNV